jgi:hypothetical protein
MNLGFPRILAITVLGSWLLASFRFLLEYLGVPALPYLFDPLWMAPIAGAMIALEAGRFDTPTPLWLALMALYSLLSRLAIGAFMFLAHSLRLDSPLARHDDVPSIILTQLLWALVTFFIALFASAIARRIVKEVSERPTGQM